MKNSSNSMTSRNTKTNATNILPNLVICPGVKNNKGVETRILICFQRYTSLRGWEISRLDFEIKQDWVDGSVQFSSVTQSCPTLCDPMNCSTPGLPVHHQLPDFTQTDVHRVGDAIQPSHPLSSPSPPAPNPSQHQGLFQWVNSLHEVAKVLELQIQHQSFQWTPRTDL